MLGTSGAEGEEQEVKTQEAPLVCPHRLHWFELAPRSTSETTRAGCTPCSSSLGLQPAVGLEAWPGRLSFRLQKPCFPSEVYYFFFSLQVS